MIIGPLTSPSSPSVRFTAFEDPIMTKSINIKNNAGVIYMKEPFIRGFTIEKSNVLFIIPYL